MVGRTWQCHSTLRSASLHRFNHRIKNGGRNGHPRCISSNQATVRLLNTGTSWLREPFIPNTALVKCLWQITQLYKHVAATQGHGLGQIHTNYVHKNIWDHKSSYTFISTETQLISYKTTKQNNIWNMLFCSIFILLALKCISLQSPTWNHFDLLQ